MDFSELLLGEVGNDGGAILEGAAEVVDHGDFVLVGGSWSLRSDGILESGTEGKVGCGDVGHQFAEGHRGGVGAKGVLLRGHGLGDGDREFVEGAEMLRVLGGAGEGTERANRGQQERERQSRDQKAGFHAISFLTRLTF